MTDVKEFLGEIAAKVVQTMIGRGHAGLRLQNVTEFDPAAMLRHLSVEPRPRVAVAGSAHDLARATKYPSTLLTAELAKATKWRNDPNITDAVVIVSFGEEERLGSFHRFTEIRDQHLYRGICETAQKEVCPNNVLIDWWRVLAREEVSRQVSVYRLASYFLHLRQNEKQIPEASRDGLFLLGLLPSKRFFEHATPTQLLLNIRNNRLLVNRIEILNRADRDRLSRAVEAASATDRPQFDATLGKILKYNRSGTDEDRAKLSAEQIRDLFEARKGGNKIKAQRVIPIERAGVDAILDGDEKELTQLGKRLRETIRRFEEDETPNVTLELTNRTEQASAKIPPQLVRLLSRAITPDLFGGRFDFPNSDTFDAALGDLDNAEFTGFTLEGERSFQTLLRRVIDLKLIEPEVMDKWDDFLAARGVLAEHSVAIAVSPMVALTSEKLLLEAGQNYLEAYAALTGTVRDRYEAIASQSATGARHLCAQLLVLDTILLKTPSGAYALLSPLHPLHLWKYVRLATQLLDERETLAEEQKRLLGESAERLPHFVTALFIPEGLLSNHHALVLPESHQIATLPCYQQDNPHYAGAEGQDRLIRILSKFLVLYPHAKRSLRVCLVDPPDLAGFLEQLATQITNEELPIQGIHLSVHQTLDRPLSLGTDDQQLETIASVFASDDSPRFVLKITQERTTYQDVQTQLQKDPVHILAIFDPSRSQVGRFTSHDPGFIHPLVLPKMFQYDPIEDQLVISPAATGDLFDVYYNLQNRLNNSLTGSHFGVTSSLGPDFPKTGEFLKNCTWLVLGDKLIDAIPTAGGHMISFEPGSRRDIIVLAESLTKFERAFDYYLRRANLDPTEDSLKALISASAELVGEGLLGLIRPNGDE